MPEVAGQDFPYTEEGVAAAEEAANEMQPEEQPIDEQSILAALMGEMPEMAEESVEESVEEPSESSESTMPSSESMSQLFEVVFGDDFDASDEVDVAKMNDIQSFLAQDPVMAEAVAAGELGLTEVALKFYRSLSNLT
jgi:hypothetical protein